MADITETPYSPTQDIIELANSYVQRRKKFNYVRILMVLVNIIAAVVTIIKVRDWIIIHPTFQAIGQGMIAIAGIFYGTVAFGLMTPSFTASEKIADAEYLKEAMQKINDKNPKLDDTSFFEKLEKLLRKFYE